MYLAKSRLITQWYGYCAWQSWMLSGGGLRKMDEISRRDEGRQLGLPERRQGASYLSVPLHLAARLGIDVQVCTGQRVLLYTPATMLQVDMYNVTR